jgi:hypothetical protein
MGCFETVETLTSEATTVMIGFRRSFSPETYLKNTEILPDTEIARVIERFDGLVSANDS